MYELSILNTYYSIISFVCKLINVCRFLTYCVYVMLSKEYDYVVSIKILMLAYRKGFFYKSEIFENIYIYIYFSVRVSKCVLTYFVYLLCR